MKLILSLLALIMIVSCGKNPRYGSKPEQYFFENGWVKNRFYYSTGSKISNHTQFTIPDCQRNKVVVTIRVPQFDNTKVNNCKNGRILSLDLDKVLGNGKFNVLKCYTSSNNIYYADIEFFDMPLTKAIFDYQAF